MDYESTGYGSQAEGAFSHAEGEQTKASGRASHTEGVCTNTFGAFSHAEGIGTTAIGVASHVEGKYNITDSKKRYLHIAGNGDENTSSNAYTLDWDGNAWFAGDVHVGGKGQLSDDNKLVTMKEVKELIAAAVAEVTTTS